MTVCACTVTFKERGSEHTVEVVAETAYEAAILAIKKFERNRLIKGPSRHAVFEVKATHTQCHKVKVGDALDWLYSKPAQTAEQKDRKKYLKAVLADDRH